MKPLLLLAALACGCAGPGMMRPRPALIYEDSAAPLAYRAPVRAQAHDVRGESCRNAIGLPLFLWGGWDLVGWGDGAYRDAVAKAQALAPGETLSDVRADVRFTNVLIWREECVVVTASAR